MQIGDRIEPSGVYIKNKESGKLVKYLPEFLTFGEVHRVTHVNPFTMWGILIKTDRHQEWMNAGWFAPI
jgi:hypothetical protein